MYFSDNFSFLKSVFSFKLRGERKGILTWDPDYFASFIGETEMKKLKFVNVLISMIMIFSMIPFGVLPIYAQDQAAPDQDAAAQDTGSAGISKSKTADRVELFIDEKQVELTLSLPSDEFKDVFDILFVVDASNQSYLNEKSAADLMNYLAGNQDLNFNVGVIKFKGKPLDMIDYESGGGYSGFTRVNDSTKDMIVDAFMEDPDDLFDPTTGIPLAGNGTNIPDALLLAQQWLENETEAPDENKFVLLFTDGRSYIFDNGNGSPACIYQQRHRSNRGYLETPDGSIEHRGTPFLNAQSQESKYSAYTLAFPTASFRQEWIDQLLVFGKFNCNYPSQGQECGGSQAGDPADFEMLFNYENYFTGDKLALLNTQLKGTSPYETTCYYVESATKDFTLPDSTVAYPPYSITNYTNKFGYPVFGSYYEVTGNTDPFLEFIPFEVSQNADGTYEYTDKWNKNSFFFNVSGQEKSLYQAAHYWEDLNDKYFTIAVLNNRSCVSGYETMCDFMPWMAMPDHSDLAASVGAWLVPGAENLTKIEDVFDALKNKIIYVVGKADVTDPIPDYLDLVLDAYDGIPFKVTLDGVELTPTELGNNDWAFGDKDVEGNYPYEVKYDTDTKTIDFLISVPVENAHPVKLMYTLEWNDTGEWDELLDTNDTTTITYCASDDPNCSLDGCPATTADPDCTEPTVEEYEIPQVKYHYEATGTAEILITKALSDGDQWPEDATATFTLSGSEGAPMPEAEEDWSVTLDDAGDISFEIPFDLDHAGIEYTYTIEETTEGFSPAWTNDAEDISITVEAHDNGDGTLTFVYDPEFDDENPIIITNSYEPEPVSVDPPVRKIIENRTDLYNGGDFFFFIENIEAPEGVEAPLPEQIEISNSPDFEKEGEGMEGFYEFGEITFTRPGEYTYRVTESGEVPGVINPDPVELTFIVTEDEEGNLIADPEGSTGVFAFTNVYDVVKQVEIVINKQLDPFSRWPLGGSVVLTLTGSEGAPMPEETSYTLLGPGAATFEIDYHVADAAGSPYTYTITETSQGFDPARWTADPTSVTVTVEAVYTEDYDLVVDVTYDPEDATIINEFTNGGDERHWYRLDTLPRTGFSALQPQALTEQPKDIQYNPLMWHLELPTISVSSDIVEIPFHNGEYPVEWIGKNVGLLEGSAMPGEGIVLLTGHNHLNTTEAGPFALLSALEIGDHIFVTDSKNNLKTFEVFLNTKIGETDIMSLRQISESVENSITMITCEDERPEGGYANRRIVAAKPIG